MSIEAQSEDSTYVGFDMESEEDKRQLRVRAAELGFSSMSGYVRALVYEDLGIDLNE